MSVKLMSAIFETEMHDLSYVKDGEERKAKASTCKLVLLAIADHANDQGESSYPGYDKLEIKTALSRQGIADTLDALKFNGLLFVAEEPSKLGTNDYTINLGSFPRLCESSGLTQPSQVAGLGGVKPLDHNHPLTIIQPSSALDFKKRTEDALFKGIAERPNVITVGMNQHDISDWPEDVRPALKAVCEQWGLVPPALREKRTRPKGRGAFWLESLREINSACAEFAATDVLVAVREDFVRHMQEHGGLAPFTVSGPSSLVNVAAAKAGAMRTASQATKEPPRKEFPRFDESGRAILE